MLANSEGTPGTTARALPSDRLERALRWFAPLLATAALAWAALLLVRLWPFTVDDTFITLRYARHIAAGLGPVWNAGPVHDEGYTSPLWTILLALPHLLHVDAEAAAKWLGLAAHLGTIVAVAALARTGLRALAPDTGWRWAGAVALLYALSAPVAVHAVSGMETAAFTLALTLLALACARALQPGRPPRPWVLASLALVTGLLRPEGHVLAAVMIVGTLLLLPRGTRTPIARASLLVWVLPATLWMAWRWSYYGLPLPLPFYVKVAQAAPFAGLPRVLEFLLEFGLPLALLLPVGLVPPPRPLRPALLSALVLLVAYVVPEHLMGYHFRYLVPAAPVLFAVSAAGLARWETHGAKRPSPGRVATAGAFALFSGMWLCSHHPAVIASRRTYAECFDRAHRAVAASLAALPPGRLAISDAGIIPYRTDWPALDLVGLNDRHIATTHDRSAATVFGFRPDVLVLASQERERFVPFGWNAWETPLAEAAAARGFRLADRVRFHDGYWLWVIVDPASATGRALLARLTGQIGPRATGS